MAEQARPATAFDRKGITLRPGVAHRFFRIAKLLEPVASVEEQMTLLGLTRRGDRPSSSGRRIRTPSCRTDTLERISYIVGVYKALQLLLPDETAADDRWVKRPNTAPLFGGRSALDRVLCSPARWLGPLCRTAIPRRTAGWLGVTLPVATHRMEAVLADHPQPVSADRLQLFVESG